MACCDQTQENSGHERAKRRKRRWHSDMFSDTATKDPSNAGNNVRLLKCPETSRRCLNKFLPKWNQLDRDECYEMPFPVHYNRGSHVTERRQYDLIRALKEPMLMVKSYEHNTPVKGGGRKTGCNESGNDSRINEIDILVVHRRYGLLLFEVKDMRQVIKIGGKTEGGDDRCPIKMIKDADENQLSSKKWIQIKKYLENFFDNEQVKKNWQEHWGLNNNAIDAMLENINNEKNWPLRSFLCLFYVNKGCKNDGTNFCCNKKDCTCLGKNTVSVKSCNVLSENELKDVESFKTWWQIYFSQTFPSQTNVFQLETYEFLLNRFGLDFLLSDYICKSVDTRVADESIRAITERVKSVFQWQPKMNVRPNVTMTNKEIAILWDVAQKRVLVEAVFAIINGYPGTGKTILMVEKILTILDEMENDDTSADPENRILVICGRDSEGLKAMLEGSEEFLKSQSEARPQTLFIFTDDYFEDWCKKQKNKRFRHIFLDESQDLGIGRLCKILETNMTNKKGYRHFWVLRDSCQCEIRTDVVNFCSLPESSIWRQEENYFTTYCLRYVYRLTQSQFLNLIPFMERVSCRHCRDRRQQGEHDARIVCEHCGPLHGVDHIIGPKLLQLPLLKGEGWCKNTAEVVAQAIVRGWREFIKRDDKLEEMYFSELKKMYCDGLFQKTVVLTENPYQLIDELEAYFEDQAGLDNFVLCSAKEFYELESENRKKCLIVDTWMNFKGLEASVVIMVNPFANYTKTNKLYPMENHWNDFIVSFSRANCLNVVITKKDSCTTETSRQEKNLVKTTSMSDNWAITSTAYVPIEERFMFSEALIRNNERYFFYTKLWYHLY